jgi:hypothetical protein
VSGNKPGGDTKGFCHAIVRNTCVQSCLGEPVISPDSMNPREGTAQIE